MDDLIGRYLRGHASPEDEELLQRWRRSPENERYFRGMEVLWSLTSAVGPHALGSAPPDSETLIAMAEARAEQEAPIRLLPAGPSARKQGRWWTPTSARGRAAVAAAVALIAFAAGTAVTNVISPAGAAAENVIATGPDEMTTVNLADGSSIRLGPESVLRFAGDGQDRMVSLNGRAFFGVQADPSRTFTVLTEQGRAVVFGTRFEVRSEAEEFRVLVVDGNVHVDAGGQTADLQRGEMGRKPVGAPLAESSVSDPLGQLEWMGNTLLFHATPLSRAIEEIERRYGLDVILERRELERVAVTMTFTDQPVDEVIAVLCAVIDVACSVEGDEAHIGLPRTG